MIIPLSHRLQTSRFFLRIPSAEDIPFIFSATRFEGFNDGMLWDPPASEAELLAPLQNTLAAWKAGEAYSFTIVDKVTTRPLGRISIREIPEADAWDVGFWTHPAVQSQGVMTEALRAVLQFGFEELAAQRIEAAHAVWNKASSRVLVKNGLNFVRHIPQGFQKRGEWIAEDMLAISRVEWKAFVGDGMSEQ